MRQISTDVSAVQNVRLRRTQKLLREALIELIEEQGFDKLTVGELTERALVSRAAFYRNYQDKYALVEQIFEEAMQSLFAAISVPNSEQPSQSWVRFFEHIATYERLYGALLGRKGSSWFVLKMRAALLELFKRYESFHLGQRIYDRSPESATVELIPNLVVTLIVETITWWLEQGRPDTPAEIAKRCGLLAAAILKETNTWQ